MKRFLLLLSWTLLSYSAYGSSNFIFIKGGTFVMGNTTNVQGNWNEIKHKVTLSSYYMAEAEVTFDQFDTYTTERGIDQINSKNLDGILNYIDTGRGSKPVINVTWFDAIKYANWLSEKEGFPIAYNEKTGELLDDKGRETKDITKVRGYRLPTEAEWEYAARERGKDIVYAWGNGEPVVDGKPVANIGDETLKTIGWPVIWGGYTDGYSTTAPVKSFIANELGLYDMTGNVWEWCHDWFGDYVDNVKNPIGSDSGIGRIYRGGSWFNDFWHLRNSNRYDTLPENRSSSVGFRLVRSY